MRRQRTQSKSSVVAGQRRGTRAEDTGFTQEQPRQEERSPTRKLDADGYTEPQRAAI